MKCHQCGCELHATAKFCLSCGVGQIRASAPSLSIPAPQFHEEEHGFISSDSQPIEAPLIQSAFSSPPLADTTEKVAVAASVARGYLKKYILIGLGLVVLVGIGVGVYWLNRTKIAIPGDVAATPVLPVYPSSVATLQPYELGQAIFLFMPDLGKKTVQWNHRANEQVVWKDESFKTVQGSNGQAQLIRTGLLRINVLGGIHTILKGKEYELAWTVTYVSEKNNPEFGVEKVLIDQGVRIDENLYETGCSFCDFEVEASLKKTGINFKNVCQNGSGGNFVRVYLLSHPKRESAILVHEASSGSRMSHSSISLIFGTDAQSLCAETSVDSVALKDAPATEAKQPSQPTTVEAPTISVGDKYIYETETTDAAGKVSTSTATREVTAIDGDRVTVTVTSGKTGKARTLIYDRSLNILETGNSPDSGTIYSPAIKYFDFPLTIGKKWSATSTETDKKTGKTRQHIVNGEVIGWDENFGTLQNRKLDGLKIRLETEVSDGDKRSTGTDISWYIPSIGRTARSEITGQDADGQQEKKTTKLSAVALPDGWKQAMPDSGNSAVSRDPVKKDDKRSMFASGSLDMGNQEDTIQYTQLAKSDEGDIGKWEFVAMGQESFDRGDQKGVVILYTKPCGLDFPKGHPWRRFGLIGQGFKQYPTRGCWIDRPETNDFIICDGKPGEKFSQDKCGVLSRNAFPYIRPR